MENPETWLVVANAARYQLYRVDRAGKRLEPLADEEHAESRRRTEDLVTDRPGRRGDGAGGQKSAVDTASDPKRDEHLRFAAEVAATLDHGAKTNRYERLIVVAAPRALGDLRDKLSPVASGRIVKELDKNMAGADPRTLAEQLGDELWP